jgi:hypothetical protein
MDDTLQPIERKPRRGEGLSPDHGSTVTVALLPLGYIGID